MTKTEQQRFEKEEWIKNLKYIVGDLTIAEWTGLLVLIEQKVRASNNCVLQAYKEELGDSVKTLAEKHAPINGRCKDDCELCDGYNLALSDIKPLLQAGK